MFSRIITRRTLQTTTRALRSCQPRVARPVQRRTLVSAPKPGDGPLMERRPDRELPDVDAYTFKWRRSLPIFVGLIAAASLAIFNYQKVTSPVVASTLYALRTSPTAREALGDEIYFAQSVPWISGTMNQLRGQIDIHFRVRGTRGEGVMRFASFRPGPRAVFETTEWTLETADGRHIDLLDAEGGDPFRGLDADGGVAWDEDNFSAPVGEPKKSQRGFRSEL